MPDKGPEPKNDVADMLESLARQMREAAERPDPGRVLVTPTPDAVGDGPSLGALDVFTDARAVTVTIETRNADAAQVRVSLLDGRLLIHLGEGPKAFRRDLPLPVAVDEEMAAATFRNGVLDVVLPLRR